MLTPQPVKLYYYQGVHPNFGDDLNPWLWPQLLPEFLDDDARVLFVGIGTILTQALPEEPRKVIAGAGAGYGTAPAVDDRWNVYCVRGPLTAQRLGLDASVSVTDPAVLLSTLSDRISEHSERADVAFMPHHKTASAAAVTAGRRLIGPSTWAIACAASGVTYIDPMAPVEETLRAIASTEILITEAMHGAIVADALRVPWIPVRLYDHILEFKWQDWCRSMELVYHPVTIGGVRAMRSGVRAKMERLGAPFRVAEALKRIARERRPRLSSDVTLHRRVDQFQEVLYRLIRDYGR